MSKAPKTPAKVTKPAPAKPEATGNITSYNNDSTGNSSTSEPTYQDIDRLEQAQNLPEIGLDDPRQNASTTIQVFKGLDRRTMRVVVSGGTLYQQAI